MREPDDVEALSAACGDLGLTLRRVDEGADMHALAARGPVLCAVNAVTGQNGGHLRDAVAAMREIGALPIAVLSSLDASAALRVTQGGYALWFESPLPAERLRRLFEYLRGVTPSDSAVALTLDEATATLRVGERSTRVTSEEFVLLRAWAKHPGRIVTAETLPPNVAARMRAITGTLRRERLPSVGSAARIITVPGIGYRLLGTITLTSPKSLIE